MQGGREVATVALTTCWDGCRGCHWQWGDSNGNSGCNGDKNNNQFKAEMVAAVMATATATVSSESKDANGATLDTKDSRAEVIGMEGNKEDCGADARSLLMAVVRLRR
jgi:hypothetical protein